MQKAQTEIEKKFIFAEKEQGNKKSTWKAQHEDFINNLRYQRNYKKIEDEGGDVRVLGMPPPTQQQDNLVPCPYCSRRFNPGIEIYFIV